MCDVGAFEVPLVPRPTCRPQTSTTLQTAPFGGYHNRHHNPLKQKPDSCELSGIIGAADGTRTRGLRRDRPAL
jgi:hypothetical protein